MITLSVNGHILNEGLRDLRHAASLITYTYELNNENVEYDNVLESLRTNYYYLVDNKSRLKLYEFEFKK